MRHFEIPRLRWVERRKEAILLQNSYSKVEKKNIIEDKFDFHYRFFSEIGSWKRKKN